MFQNRQTALPYISPEPSEMSIESAEQTTWAFPPRNFIVAPNQSSEPTTSIGASTPASTPSTEPQQSDMNGVECHTNCNYHPSTGMQCSPDPRVHASHQLAPTPQWNYQSGPVESLQMFYHTSSIPFTEESPSSGLSYPQNQPAPQWPLGQTFDYPIMDENGYRHPYPIPQGHENMQNPMQQ
jgi:hypothetical protein